MSHSDHRILACLRNIRGFLLVTSSHRMLPHRTQRTGVLISTRAMCVTLLLNVALACAPAVAQTSYAFSGSTTVGQSSQPVSVSVTMIAGGVAAAPRALTLGSLNADFVNNGGSCSEGTSYSSGQQCSVTVTFQPRYPGVRSGAVVLLSNNGTLLGSTLLTGMAAGSLSVLSPGEIDTVVGVTDWLYQGDGVLATDAPIFLPMGVAVDAKGNLYLADSNNDRIRRVDGQSGLITTIAGNGTSGYSGDGGLATAAMISNPGGVVLDGAGDLYFADSNNDVIRRVDAVSGIITTVAGTPQVNGYSGNGGLATSARLSKPEGLALDAAGDFYIADTGNHAIREVSATTGTISTVAGTGVPGYNGDHILAIDSELSGPWSLSLGPDGSLYIADTTNQRVRMVTAATGIITTLAGTGTQGASGDGAVATAALLNAPAAVLLDPAGNLYIADSGNNRIRKISVATGDIQTLSGGSTEGFSGDGGPANLADMYGPYALVFDQSGNLFFSDMFNNRVREIHASVATLPPFPVMRVGKVSAPQIQGLVNNGNADLVVGTSTLLNAQLDLATTTCNAGSTLTFNIAGNLCNFGVDFAPTNVGADVLGTVTAPSNAGNSPAIIHLSGEVLTVQPTTVSLSSSRNPSLIGTSVTFTATISAGGDTTSGTVSFLNNGTLIAGCGNITEGSNQMAACSTTALPLGSSAISASYSGDANDASSISPAIQQVVKQPATIALTASPNPAVVTATVALTATATAATGTPTGTVTFYDGATVIGSANLNSGGGASFSTTSLAVGTQNLTAQYSGDTSNATGTSPIVNEIIQQATTTTTLSSSSSTATVGTAVTFTATVTSANGPAPGGTVEFMNGSIVLGNGTVNPNGTATLVLSSLAPGSYSIVAAYSGDIDDATSSSTILTEIIQQIPTATTLTASTNPISTGATLNLSAAVAAATGTSTNGGTLGGNVTFSEGPTVYGTVGINSAGDAILPLTTLSAGSHFIIASYSGNTNYAPSTSAVLDEVVLSTATITTLSSPATTTLAGERASFTAIVSSTTAIPTGSVAFEEGGVSIGQAQLNAQGIATFSTTALAVGTQIITAIYGGNGNYNSSTSAALQHTVVLATPSLILTGPSTAVDAGTTFGLTATLSSNGAAPSGTLTLRNGGATIATQSVSAGGTFSFANLSLGVGTYQLTAAFSGDTNNASAVSVPITLTVQLTPTVTSLSSGANPSILGQSLTFTASTSGGTPAPTGVLQFLDGATVLGSSTLSTNGTATLTTTALTFGTHSITASYGGDTDHALSISNALNEKIVQPVSALLNSSVNPSIFGSNVLFTVKITGVGSQVPSGTVVLRNGTSALGTVTLDNTGTGTIQVATLPVGSDIITASYSGDTNYSAASAFFTQTVQSATTQVTLTLSQNPAIYATPITFTSAVTGNGGIVQAGSVNFTDADTSIGSAALSSNGVAVLTVPTLAPGPHSIVANYGGESYIGASSSAPQILLVKELTTTVLASTANPTATLSSIVLSANVINSGVGKPTGAITFSDGPNLLGTATLNVNGVASFTVPSLSAGNHSLLASYAGDTQNFASTSTSLVEGVQLRPTATALSSSPTDPANPLQITLISVVNWSGPIAPTGTMTFTAGSTILGSTQLDSIGVATLNVTLSSATEEIIATYSGDASYASSASLATTISGGTATQFTMQLNPSTITLQSKQHASTSITLTSLAGFSDTLQLGCLGLPNAATCTFSTPQVSLPANGTVTVQLIVDTGDPLGAGSTAALQKKPTSGILLCLLPCLLCLGLGARRRKVRAGAWLMLLLMISTTFLTTGCAGLSINGTPPGTYTFKVTASGQGSGSTISQTVALTVTQ
jgi:sugar lactone lactonase YvrE